MKAKKTFAVRIEIDGINGYCGINCNFKTSTLYFSDMICEKKNDIINIIPFLKKLKDIKIEMITLCFETHDESFRSTFVEQYRYINRYSEKRIAKFNGHIFDFDQEETKTEITFDQFIKRYSDILNNTAYFEYMKYISDIER